MTTLFDKLEVFKKRYDELNEKLYDPSVVNDQEKYTSIMKEQKNLQPIVEKYEEYKKYKNNLEEAKEMLNEGGIDKDFRDMLEFEIDESKEKLRKSTLEYLYKMKDIKCPRYNVKSIEYINLINDKYGWNLQHAENGGEVEICGFYVDGYDKDLNIVFEYDEPNHYKDVKNSILKNKDIERQNIIIEKTGCTFYRYNEYIDLLYVVSK